MSHLIAQISPPDTNIHEIIKDPNPGCHHIIHEIVISNANAAAKTYSLYHGKVVSGALGNTQSLGIDIAIAANTSIQRITTIGWEVGSGEIFGVQSSVATDITFTFYGILNEKDK